MSEAERLRRQEYKRNRKKWILIQAIALACVFAIALTCFAVYNRMNRTYFIEYTEKGNVDYKVFLKDNAFYEDEYVGPGQSYVSSLIENVTANFVYDLVLDAENVGFDYSYKIACKYYKIQPLECLCKCIFPLKNILSFNINLQKN